MTEPDESASYVPPGASLRAIYDEEGRLNSICAEFLQTPPAEELARLLAQFLMPQVAKSLPQRTAGMAAARRDPILARQFEEVIREGCSAVMNVLDASDSHDNHICTHVADHPGQHLCDCGLFFGG